MKATKRTWRHLLLAMALVLTMVPMLAAPASAAEEVVEVGSYDELRSALNANGAATVKVTADIIVDGTLAGDDDERAIKPIWSRGAKGLDLNGHKISFIDRTNGDWKKYGNNRTYFPYEVGSNFHEDTMIYVSGTLTIEDSAGGGILNHDGHRWGWGNSMGFSDDLPQYNLFCVRDVINVRDGATLIVNGGTIEAGSVERQWMTMGARFDDPDYRGPLDFIGDGTAIDRNAAVYDGYVRQQVWGSAVTVESGGTLLVNGGTLKGRGMGKIFWHDSYSRENGDWYESGFLQRDEVIEVASGGTVCINGGTFVANGGADLFAYDSDTVAEDITVRGGTFTVDKHDRIRGLDMDGHSEGAGYIYNPLFHVDYMYTTYKGSYGSLNIPENDGIFIRTKGQTATVMQTGHPREGIKCSVIAGGMGTDVTNQYSSADWNPSTADFGVDYSVDDYFLGGSLLDGHEKTFTWNFYRGNSYDDTPDYTYGGASAVRLSDVQNKCGMNWGSEDKWLVECVVTESFNGITVQGRSLLLNLFITTLPTTVEQLPEEPTFTIDHYDGGVTVILQPQLTVEELTNSDNDFCADRVTFAATYTNTAGEEVTTYHNGSVVIQDLSMGITDITLTWRLWDGNRMVEYSATKPIVRLADPAVTTNSSVVKDANGVYVSNGAAVNAYMTDFSDIEYLAGWYEVYYDEYDQCYKYYRKANSNDTSYQFSSTGRYCYGYELSNGEVFYSKPFEVKFSTDGLDFSATMSVSKTTWKNTEDPTLTLNVGSGFRSGDVTVYYQILSFPKDSQGFNSGLAAKNDYVEYAGGMSATTNYTMKGYGKLLRPSPDEEKLIPGVYTVRAKVIRTYSDGTEDFAYSNSINLIIDKEATSADILSPTGWILSDTASVGSLPMPNGREYIFRKAGEKVKLSAELLPAMSNLPTNYTCFWSIEDVIGTDVAIIDNATGEVTALNPGKAKVTLAIKVGSTTKFTQTCHVLVPVTDYVVNIADITIGGDSTKIVSIPEDAPYTVSVGRWSGTNTSGQFLPNYVPSVWIDLKPKEGYIAPLQLDIASRGGTNPKYFTWEGDASTTTITINGETFSAEELGADYESSCGYASYADPALVLDFNYIADERLRDPSHTYLNLVEATFELPQVGQTKDRVTTDDSVNLKIFDLDVETEGVVCYMNSVVKVPDRGNSTATETMQDSDTYEKDMWYRATFVIQNPNGSSGGVYFEENPDIVINGQSCRSAAREGDFYAQADYYFKPAAAKETVSTVKLTGVPAPSAYKTPVTTATTDHDEVYVSRMVWFVDKNKNGKLDSGEDSFTNFYNGETFKPGVAYSLYVELDGYDYSGDDIADYVTFPNNMTIKVGNTSASNTMTGNANGAVLTYMAAEASMPSYFSRTAYAVAAVGETALFNVEAVGADLSYQWQFSADDGSTWANATATGNKTDTLRVPATMSRDGYLYQCIISNEVGSITVGPCTLYVKEQATLNGFYTQPRNVQANVGENVRFEVYVNGTSPDYQWQYSTDGVKWYDSPAEGADTPVLKLRATADRNGYHYRCVVSNAAGTQTSLPATLIVHGAPAAITLQPANCTVSATANATFSVEVVGGTDLSYQWEYRTSATRKWAAATAAGNKTSQLTISPANLWRNGYQYRCVITDGDNVLTSNPATLTVLDPSITTFTANTVLKGGEKAGPIYKLYPFDFVPTVAKNGYEPHSMSNVVYCEEKEVDGETVQTAITGDTQLAAGGTYLVYVTYFRGAGFTFSDDIKVTVDGKVLPTVTNVDDFVPNTAFVDNNNFLCIQYRFTIPGGDTLAISKQPADQRVAANATAKFTVEATGKGLTYQWQYRTPSVSSWASAAATGNKTATMSVPATASRNGYQYRCAVTDSNGETVYSNPAVLAVGNGPVIVAQPKNANVSSGTNAKFTVEAFGEGLTYQWQYRTSSAGTWYNATASGNKSDTLTVPGTGRNGYQYRCKVTSGASSVISSAATLSIKSGVAITTQPKDTTVSVGGTAKFTVAATGSNLTYQWQFRGSASGTWTKTTATGYNTATLSIPGTANRSGYQYRCIVSDGTSSVESNAATLTVKAAETLSITTQPKDTTVNVGDTAKFTVAAAGSNLTYQWQFRGSASGTWTKTTATGYNTATLSIPGTANRNGYQYRCIVSNGSSSVQSNAATLTVKSAQTLSITTQPKDVLTTADATAKFTVAATGSNLSYQWKFSKNGTTWSNATASGNTTATLNLGTAGTSRDGYKYKCVITDGTNTVETNVVTLKIKPKITTQPKSVTAGANDTVSFTVKASGNNLQYQWQFKTGSSSWTDNTCTEATFTIVKPGAWRNGYQYRCIVSNENGTATSSAATLTVG